MIAKVTKGTSFAGLTGYLYGPGLHEEHLDAHMVGGNLAVEDRARVIAEELRDVAQENPRVLRPVFHASLALPEGERLTDEQWQRAGERFLDEMGFRAGDREAPWAIVRHDGQEGRHAHIVASRVRFDGSTVSDSYDYKRSHQACRAVEADHGLSSPQPSPERLASVSRSERESAQRRGVAPERGELRQALEQARDSGDGTREDFERRAGERGVLLRANESASTGRMNGYSASLEGVPTTSLRNPTVSVSRRRVGAFARPPADRTDGRQASIGGVTQSGTGRCASAPYRSPLLCPGRAGSFARHTEPRRLRAISRRRDWPGRRLTP